MPTYTETTLAELAALSNGVVLGRRLIRPRVPWNMPAVEFGDTVERLKARGKEEAVKFWSGANLAAGDVVEWSLAGATVHGPYGVVTVGSQVIVQSLNHVPFGRSGYERKDKMVTLPQPETRVCITDAWHGASGAYINYYHWLLDILPRLQIAPFGDAAFTGEILMPPAEMAFQRETAAILAGAGLRLRTLAMSVAAEPAVLRFLPNMTGGGFAPHPLVIEFYGKLAAAAAAGEAAPQKLYITRAGAVRRRLRNEESIIASAKARGFEICDPAGMPFNEQIARFRAATHIVAPHGAGLANIVFARPGAVLCELQMDDYMNLCFRKIAALQRLRYGCVVGDADAGQGGPLARHQTSWTIDRSVVEQALDAAIQA
jgi:hypothetical protein